MISSIFSSNFSFFKTPRQFRPFISSMLNIFRNKIPAKAVGPELLSLKLDNSSLVKSRCAYYANIIRVLYEYQTAYHTRIKSVSYAYYTSIIRVSKVYHTRIIRVSNGVSYACYTSMIRVLYEYYTRTIRKNVKKYVSGTVHIGMELTCADITGVDTKIIHYTKPRTNASFG